MYFKARRVESGLVATAKPWRIEEKHDQWSGRAIRFNRYLRYRDLEPWRAVRGRLPVQRADLLAGHSRRPADDRPMLRQPAPHLDGCRALSIRLRGVDTHLLH